MKLPVLVAFGWILIPQVGFADIKLPPAKPNEAIPAPRSIADYEDVPRDELHFPVPAVPQVAKPGFELPPVMNAASLLPKEVLVSTVHRVREQVATDGFEAWFVIDSEYGIFHCAGVEAVITCVHEIEAIRKLTELSRTDVFAEGLKRSVEQPIEAVKNVMTKPVETVKAVPKSVGHFFKKVGKAIKTTSSGIRDRIENDGEKPLTESLGDAGKGIGKTAASIVGFDSAKLECARQLGIDPYSDNQRLRDEINKVAWVFFAGGLPLKIGAAAVTAGGSTALSVTKFVGLPDEVYKLTPVELNLRNQETLKALQVPEELRLRFASNPVLTVSTQRSIVLSLQRLNGVKGLPQVVELAATCESRQQSSFLERSLRLLAQQQAAKAGYSELAVFDRLLVVKGVAGWQVPAPVDLISWTEDVADFATRPELVALKPQLLLPGKITDKARERATAAGWQITQP